ncbi:hypothetical protein [uncultured Tyzzerella sp.]|uniref:YkvI family membrane protein n=1 Tax=uncultured Tyzzerella sp. TaxID=2321398 RepID=UPI002943BC4F|nr:hypothetical protein [uncultured Tyzzerella sp.]
MLYKYILKIALVYTGTILGAGFATGKELVSFFAQFGNMGILGFLISCLLLALTCMSILNMIYKTKVNTYSQFIHNIFGRYGVYIEWFNIALLFILFSAMLAGGGATLCNMFNINEMASIIIFCIITFIALIFGKDAIININTILCPILILGGILIGIYVYFNATPVFNNNIKPIISPFIYTSYNGITTISVLFAIRDIVKNKKIVIYSSILGGVFIFSIGIFMLLPLTKNYDYIYNSPLPLLKLIENKSIIKNIYAFTVLSAIFTTAVSNGVALETTFKEKYNINGLSLKIILIVVGISFSLMGFSNIVNIVYPIFGAIGMFEILVIMLSFFSSSIDK